MPAFIPYLVFPFGIFFFLAKSRYAGRQTGLYLFVLAFKVAAAWGMTYLLINRYDLGDFPTYFSYARYVATGMLNGNIGFADLRFEGAFAVANLNALLFLVWPPSMYGLSILSGCASFVYCLLIIRAVERHFVISTVAKVLILFSPILSMQSGYVGKETYVLPMLGLMVYALSENRVRPWVVILIVLAVSVFRPYEVYFLGFPLILAWIFERRQWWRVLVGLILFSLLALSAIQSFEELSGGDRGIDEFLYSAYDGGMLMLEPYPVPFNFLQSFRPFPWEAHNESALVASYEYLLFLFCAMGLLWQRVRDRASRWNPTQRLLIGFMGGSVMAYMIIYGFSANLGDLSRRHVYYYPFLLLMFSRPKKVLARAGGYETTAGQAAG